jgi:citrate synthase
MERRDMERRDGDIAELILRAKEAIPSKPKGTDPIFDQMRGVDWPINCTVGPGLEGAIACKSRVGFVNGSEGSLIYRGYDIFDLSAHSTFEEVSYLLLYGELPTERKLASFSNRLSEFRFLPNTLRMMMGAPLEWMNPMAALRTGTNFMHQRQTWRDSDGGRPSFEDAIASDEDSIPMETRPTGEKRAIYEFQRRHLRRPQDARPATDDAESMDSCIHLIAGMATLAAAIGRLRAGRLPIEPDPELGHAANLLYMMTGRRPTPLEERVMDVALILHADHGMNASTFACLVVASTMSDIYFSVDAGIGALNGPLHGGANEEVTRVLREIGSPDRVPAWYREAREAGRKIPGFGHRVYKTYDPRARVLAPLAGMMAGSNPDGARMYSTAKRLEEAVVSDLGAEKRIFPNVDFYSGIVYNAMGVPEDLYTVLFAVSRVAGWTARVMEYLENNRIFRPRSLYIGDFDREYVPMENR